jgi:hypothetical protein
MAITYKTKTPERVQFFVPPGDYTLQIIDAEEDTSKSGNDMIKIKCRVVKDDGLLGVSLFDYLVFSEKTLFKIDQFLKACGRHPGADCDFSLDCEELIGWEFQATLKVEEHNGNKNNKIAAYLFEDEF